MSNNFTIGICINKNYKNHTLIELHCYSVTMASTKFVQPVFTRVMQEEFIETNFVDFGERLVLALSRYNKHVKIHTFPMAVAR